MSDVTAPRKRLARSVARAPWCVLAFTFAFACGGGGSDTTSPTDNTPAPTVVAGNSSLALSGVGADGTVSVDVTPPSATVAWRSNDVTIATVAGTGHSATVHALKGGITQVVATVTSGTKSAEATVSVTITPIVRSLTLTPPASDPLVGDVITLSATIGQADAGAATDLNWLSSNTAVATVDGTGRVTTLTVGTVIITATSRTNAAATASVTLNVRGRARAITIAPALDTLLPAATRTFTPTITADVGVVRTVQWRSSTPAVATIDGTGKATAVAVGTTTITALLDADTTIRATATLVVRAPAVLTIALSIRSQTLGSGDTATVIATVTGDPGVSKALTYVSSVTSVATVAANGLVAGLAAGATTITARSTATPTVTATLNLTVTAPQFATQWTETTDAAFGTGPDVGQLAVLAERPDGMTLGVGTGGVIAARSAAGVWAPETSPVATTLWSVSAPSNSDAWAAGVGGVILHRTASGWVQEASGTTVDLRSIAMRADGTGIAAGRIEPAGLAVLLQRVGGAWVNLPPPIPGVVTTENATVTDAAFYVAFGEAAYRYQGGIWALLGLPNPAFGVYALRALPSGDVLFGGFGPLGTASIWRLSGSTFLNEWQAPVIGTGYGVGQFVFCKDGTALAITTYGVVLHRQGTSWIEHPETELFPSVGIAGGVTCATPSSLLFTSGSGLIARAVNGVLQIERLKPNLTRVGVGPSSLAFVAPSNGNIALRWNGTSWVPVLTPTTGFDFYSGPAIAVFSNTSAKFLTAGYEGSWNGTNFDWQLRDLPARSAWGSGTNNIWTVGPAPLSTLWANPLMHFDGLNWVNGLPGLTITTTIKNVHGAGSAMFAVSGNDVNRGIVYRSTGGAVSVDSIPGTSTLTDVVVFAQNAAVVVGPLGKAFRFDGTTWTAIPTPLTENILAVTGRSISEVYAFTDQGALLGYNGTQWTLIKRLNRIVRAARMSGTTALAVGDGGTIVYGQTLSGIRR